MEFSKDFPILYCLAGNLALKRNNRYIDVVKNGSTWHGSHRKSGAFTYFPSMPYYKHLIVLSPCYFRSKSDLYKLDYLFVKYLTKRNLQEYYINGDGGKEWFDESCPISYLDLKIDFLKEMNIPILKIFETDPFSIYDLKPKEIQELKEEDSIKEITFTEEKQQENEEK